MGFIVAGDVLLQENVNGNLIRVDSEGGVLTKFGNVQESYQLTEQEAKGLVDLLHRSDARALLELMPAPKLVDLSVGMTRGDIQFSEFLNLKRIFEAEPKYMSEYRMMYEATAKTSEWELQAPHSLAELNAQMDKIKAKMDDLNMDKIPQAESLIGDAVQPIDGSVQRVDFPRIR